MLLSILSGIVKGWFWNLWCESSALRSLYMWRFPTSAPEFLEYLDEDGDDRAGFYERRIGGEETCQYYLYSWRNYAKNALDRHIQERVEWARDAAVGIVRDFTGWSPGEFNTFADWIAWVVGLTGGGVPSWATSILSALGLLYGWLPYQVRDGVKSFASWVDDKIDDATDWISDAIATVRSTANDAWDWVASTGDTLKSWYDTAHDWLDDLRSNFIARVKGALGSVWDWIVAFWNAPYATIAGWLGTPWQKVLTFAQGAFTFWHDLWANHGDDLGEFLTNPFQFVYERVEDWIIEEIW